MIIWLESYKFSAKLFKKRLIDFLDYLIHKEYDNRVLNILLGVPHG